MGTGANGRHAAAGLFMAAAQKSNTTTTSARNVKKTLRLSGKLMSNHKGYRYLSVLAFIFQRSDVFSKALFRKVNMFLTRSLHRISLWLTAIASAALLTACGGGSDGNPSNPYIEPLQLVSSEQSVYPGQPFTLYVHGGKEPFYFESSSQNIVPVPGEWDSDTLTTYANSISENAQVVIYVWDKQRGRSQAASVVINVVPSMLYSSQLVVTATGGGSCAAAAGGDGTYAQICAGGSGVAELSLVGNPNDNRQVRFDVIAGDYLLQSGNSWASTLTTVTDAQGKARVGIKAGASAVTQTAVIRVTELSTGNQITTTFMIVGAAFKITPDQASWTTSAPTCSVSRTASFSFFGGVPPYSVSTTLGSVAPRTVSASGGSVTLTVNECGSGTLTAVDSVGTEAKATISYTATGTVDTTTNVTITPAGSWGTSTTPVSCGGRSFIFQAAGGKGTYSTWVLENGLTAATGVTAEMNGSMGTVTFPAGTPASNMRYAVYVTDNSGSTTYTSTATTNIFCSP